MGLVIPSTPWPLRGHLRQMELASGVLRTRNFHISMSRESHRVIPSAGAASAATDVEGSGSQRMRDTNRLAALRRGFPSADEARAVRRGASLDVAPCSRTSLTRYDKSTAPDAALKPRSQHRPTDIFISAESVLSGLRSSAVEGSRGVPLSIACIICQIGFTYSNGSRQASQR